MKAMLVSAENAGQVLDVTAYCVMCQVQYVSDNTLLELSSTLLLSCEELMQAFTCASGIAMASERQHCWRSMRSIFHDEAAVT